ncbi:xylulokinase [Saccharospirillum impatiens]|uniref:xylulokinase n=1 Tax=Saccharospirillum impatiens TaxID=169438 RepID=UPI0003F8BDBF|nr:xylulokinase [Saccharospirillum impatiens]
MYLGLDLGTSGLKAVLIDQTGHVVDTASASLTTESPHPLWSEQDPRQWWQAIQAALATLAGRQDLKQIKGIGLSGHMHGAVLIDADHQVIRPCILWNDGRSGAECTELEAAIPDFRARSGNVAMPGFTAPKVLWVRHHEPEAFARIHKVLLPKDYLRLLLTGQCVSEMSDAAGTLWLDPAKRDWDDQLLAISGLSREQMPALIEGSQSSGRLTDVAALYLGLNPVTVAGGAGDNAAGAVGVGVTEPGQGFISLGTSGVYFVVSEQHNAAPELTVHAFCHCLPERWHQMSVMLSAASCLDWFANISNTTVPKLLEEVEASAEIETSVLFLPYLSGERTPHNNPLLSAQFFGLNTRTRRVDMTRAILEGVAFSMADGERALISAGTPLNDISLIGGGARSALWRQLIADVLQRTLHFREGGEVGPGLGAARLARLAVEGDSPENIRSFCPAPPIVQTHQPDASRALYYQSKLKKYRELHQQTAALND